VNPTSTTTTAAVDAAPASDAAAREADEHFGVDALRQNLPRAGARAGALMIGSNAVQLVLGVTGTAILARVLRPADFGYLAMVATLTNFVATFRDFGLPMATVQTARLSHEQASGLFWVNTLVSLVVAALVAACAPLLAWFYGEPRLVAIALVMSCGILVHSLSLVHVGLLRRQMNFRAVITLEIGAVLVGLVGGVGAALAGAGYWALVVQQVSIYVTESGGALLLCRWRPAPRRASATLRDPELRAMLHYGKDLSAARLIAYAGRNLDAVMVGYFAGARALGLYRKAYHWATLPFWQVYGPLLPVAVASFSRLQDDAGRYRYYARTTMLGLFSLTLPATALLLLTAEPVVLLLLGRQWVDAIPIFRVLCAGAYFSAFSLVTRWLYLSEGRTREQLRWSIIAAPVTVIGVALGARWGAIGVAAGFSAATALLAPPSIWYCLRRSPFTGGDFLAGAWRPTAASLVALGGAMLVRTWVDPMPRLIAQLALDVSAYTTLCVACWLSLPHGVAEARRVINHLRLLGPS
jgi:PST family polysaccharide transporter